MTSIEQSVKAQFAKVFDVSDWQLFKKLAESNLREATLLKTADMLIEPSLKLLARNSRKRLLIGVGSELLLKAVYLKNKYWINKPQDAKALKFPFLQSQAAPTALVADKTFELNLLIQHLPKVLSLSDPTVTLTGLCIAKVFRNKEGHGVTASHTFVESNYRDIERALVEIYRDAFAEKLQVRFSLGPKDGSVWRITR
jgi:hypothetical protein